jgi:hypothetical protein
MKNHTKSLVLTHFTHLFNELLALPNQNTLYSEIILIWTDLRRTFFGGAEEDRTPDPLRARQVLSQLSYDPFFLLRSFSLLFVAIALSFSHILTYAPSLFRACASIKEKFLAKILPRYFIL